MAAVAAYLETRGSLPCNVRFLIEGEEKIGSPHLGAVLEAHAGMLSADAVVLSDTQNLDTGVPGLTVSLRGLCVVDGEVCAASGGRSTAARREEPYRTRFKCCAS